MDFRSPPFRLGCCGQIVRNYGSGWGLEKMFGRATVIGLILTFGLRLLCLAEGRQTVPKTPDVRTPVVVELFTSEGCSSCPAADNLLARLAESQPIPDAEIIALAEHVDYWNHLGWKDPFSSVQFTERQKWYVEFFRSDGAYTPQMVVDGQVEFIGSNVDKAREAILKAARLPKASISLVSATAQRSGSRKGTAVSIKITVDHLPPISPRETTEVLLAVTESNLRTEVLRGENAGRHLRHTAVVRRFDVLGRINSSQPLPFSADSTVALESGWRIENLQAIVLVQERKSRRILGAMSIPLKPPDGQD